jgi:chitinase
MTQTAVEWLVQWLKDNPVSYTSSYEWAIQQAKQMEKEQIKKAHYEGALEFQYLMESTGQEVPYINDADSYYEKNYLIKS